VAEPAPLSCVECRVEAPAYADGWKSYLTSDEPPEAATYCPACAAEELGASARVPGMAGWHMDRWRPAGTTPDRDTGYAAKLYLEGPNNEEAEMTIEWADEPMTVDTSTAIVWARYRDDMLGEGKRPARRLIVGSDGSISVAEPSG
jgi:hypothetical protein